MLVNSVAAGLSWRIFFCNSALFLLQWKYLVKAAQLKGRHASEGIVCGPMGHHSGPACRGTENRVDVLFGEMVYL